MGSCTHCPATPPQILDKTFDPERMHTAQAGPHLALMRSGADALARMQRATNRRRAAWMEVIHREALGGARRAGVEELQLMGALKQVVDDGWNLDTSLFCDIVRKCVKGPDFKIPAVRSLVAVVLRKVFRLSDEEALELVTRKGLPVQQEFDSECVPPAQWTRPLHLGPSGGRRRTDAGPRPQYGRRHGRGHGQRQPTAGGGASSAGERHHATRLPQTIPPSDFHFRRRQRGGRGVRAPRLPNQLKHLPDPGRSRSGLAQSPQPQPVFAVTVGGAFRARASVVHGWSSGWGVGIGHRPPTGGTGSAGKRQNSSPRTSPATA